MIKAVLHTHEGDQTLYLGLSFGNLRKFIAQPLDSFIHIDGKPLGLNMDIILFSGETEDRMADLIKGKIPITIILREAPSGAKQ